VNVAISHFVRTLLYGTAKPLLMFTISDAADFQGDVQPQGRQPIASAREAEGDSQWPGVASPRHVLININKRG
jgi:hypothetical protein